MEKRRIIIGTDWWTDCDDVAAVAAACRLAKRGVWDIAGVALNACMEYSAASLDGFLRAEAGGGIPIGIDLDADDFGRQPPYQERLAGLTGSNLKNSDCEDGVKLYRRLLADAPDRSVELVEIGYEQVLAKLLESEPDEYSRLWGRELLENKVKAVWVMGGLWPDGRENNFSRCKRAVDGAASLWNGSFPVETIFLGYEVGAKVMTRPKESDRLLYSAFAAHNRNACRSSWDPMLMIAAASCPDASDAELWRAGYETVRGEAFVDPGDGSNSFRESPGGQCRYLKKLHPDEWYEAEIAAALYGPKG